MTRGVWWVGLAAAGALLAGCGSPANTDPAPTPTASAAAGPAAGTTGTAGSATGAPGQFVVVPPSGHVSGVYPPRCHSADGRHPDPACTPGAVQSNITQASIATTICRRGWTATVRAPEAETGKVKKAAMLAYGDPASASSTTELDHFIPLELGGANDVRNLWPEPSDEPGHGVQNTKDKVETDLNTAVCHGRVPLTAAQQAIATDWTTAERRLGLAR